MPVRIPNFPLPLPSATPAFSNPEELRALLFRELQMLGWQGLEQYVQVKPTEYYGVEGKKTIPGEYEVTITHPKAEGQSWFGRVRGTPNETLAVKSGAGWELRRGELLTAGLGGIPEPGDVVPWRTGIQSFARRVAAGFGEWGSRRADLPPQYTMRDTVMDYYRKLDQLRHPFGVQATGPGGVPIPGRMAAGASVYMSPTEMVSPQALSFQAGQYAVPFAGPTGEQEPADVLNQSVAALHRQVTERGLSARTPWYRLKGGYVHEPSPTGGAVFVAPFAAGSLREEEGMTVADMLTAKPYKQSVVVGKREVATPMIMAGDLSESAGARRQLEPVPERFLRQASVVMRTGAEPYTGIPLQAVTAVGEVPWQSGAKQFRLPPELEQYVAGKGGQLMAGRLAQETATLRAKGLEELIRSPFQMDVSKLGEVLLPGRRVTYTKGLPEGQNLGYTTSQQQEQMIGYSLTLPHTWRERLSEEQLTPWIDKLKAKGFQNVFWGANEEPAIDIEKWVATVGSPKGRTKGQINEPLMGVEQVLRTEAGAAIPYQVLQEAKFIEPVVLNALEAMKDPYKFLSTIYKGDREMAGAISTLRKQGGTLSLEELGQRSGRYQTAEQTLFGITEQLRQYPDQQELIRRFGMGVVGGTAPIEQYTPQMLRSAKEGLMAHLQSQGMGFRDIRQFMRTFQKSLTFDQGTGLYTSNMPQPQWVVAPQLATLVQEPAGVGSTQGEMLEGMQAQGYGGVAGFLERNMARLFPESPSRWALQNVTRAWMATRQGVPPATEQYYTVTQDMARQVRTAITAATQTPGQGPIGQTQLMALYEREMRSAAGVPENQPEPFYWSQEIRAGMAGGGAMRELESLLAEVNEEGGIDFQTQAQVATRFNKFMGQFLERTDLGQEDDWLRREIQDFQSIYTDTDQLRKQRGGIFSGAGGTMLLKPGQAMMSMEALQRYYLLQGGNPQSQREWRRYLRVMEGATGIALRYPAPNIGTQGMPGSVQPVQIMTPQPLLRDVRERERRIGPMMADAARRAGLMMPQIMLSSGYGANLGDIDIDPYTLLPLAFRTGRGREGGWKRYYGETGDNEQYSQWLREIVRKQSPAQQQRTYNAIFGSQAAQFNPWGQNMQAAIARMMGSPGERFLTQQIGGEVEQIREGLLGRRIALGTEQFQEFGEDWNLVKTRGMGLSYNVYRRRPQAAGAFLNVPGRLATEIVDIGQKPYQNWLDFEKYQTFWENLMGTSGFQSKGATEPVKWGVNIGNQPGGADFTYSTFKWDPEETDVRAIARLAGAGLGASDMPADWVSSMIMQIPERGQMTEAEQEAMLRTRRADISRRIEEARASKGTGETASNRIARLMIQLEEEGAIGERSYAAVSTMARAFEYTGKEQGVAANRERLLNVRAGMARRGGFLIGGERVPYEVAEQRYRPLSTMFDFLKHTKGEASYKDPLTIAETILAAEKGGWAGTAVMKQFRETWGEIAGIPAKGPIQVRHPITGNLMMIQEQADIEAMRQASQILEAQRVIPYERSRQLLQTIQQAQKGIKLRASDIAYPEGFTGTGLQEIARQGTRAHYALERYLKQANIPEVLSVEEGIQGRQSYPMTGTPDFLTAQAIYDLKTGKTPPSEYSGQMAAYRFLTGRPEANIMQVPREMTETWWKEAMDPMRARARAEGRRYTREEYNQAISQVGQRIYEYGMAHTTTLSGEQIGPKVFEQYTERYMQAQGIPIPPATPAPTYAAVPQQPAPATGGGGGQNIPPAGTIPGFAEPPQEPGRRSPLIRMGRIRGGQVMPPTSYMRADDLRAALGIEGGGEWGEEGEPGEMPERMTVGEFRRTYAARPDMAEVVQPIVNALLGFRGNRVLFRASGALGPKMAQAVWPGAKAAFEEAYGTIGEGSELTNRGFLAQTFQQFPQLLSQMFPGQIDRETVAGLSPMQAIAQAPELARARNLNFRRLIEANQPLRKAIEMFGLSGKMFKGIIPSMADIPESETDIAKAIQVVGAPGTAVAAAEAARLGPAGEEISNIYAGMWSLQQQYTGSKAGRVGLQPLTEQGVGLAQRWVDMIRESSKAMEYQIKVLGTVKGKHVEFNEAIEQGMKIDPKRMTERWMAFEKAETALMGKALTVRKRFGVPTEGAPGLLTQRELAEFRATPDLNEEQLAALSGYQGGAETFRKAGVSAMAAGMGKKLPPGWGAEGEGVDWKGAARIPRLLLGGFGLMYMRSVFDIMTGGAQMGYQSYQEQQAAITQMVGGQMGGMPAYWGPEQRLQQAQAPYAGSGFAALRLLQAQMYRDPQTAARLTAAQAAVAAGGAGFWLGTMAGGPMVGAGMAAAGAIAAPIGVTALNLFGAYQQPEATAQAMAARIWTGQYTPDQVQQMMQRARPLSERSQAWAVPPGEMPIVTPGSRFESYQNFMQSLRGFVTSGDTQFGALTASREAQSDLNTILRIRELVDGGMTPTQAISELGFDKGQVGKILTMYYGAEALQIQAPVEGLVGTGLLQERYPGLRLTEGIGGTREFLAGAISQGAPWIEAAQQMGAAPRRTRQEQRQISERYLQEWTNRRGLTARETEEMISGQERRIGLGPLAPSYRDIRAEEGYLRQLAEMAPVGYGLYQGAYQQYTQERVMGLQAQRPTTTPFMGALTDEQIAQLSAEEQARQQRINAQQQIFAGFTGLGMAPDQARIQMQQYQNLNLGQYAQLAQGQQFAQQMQGVMAGYGGWSPQRTTAMGGLLAQLSVKAPGVSDMVTGMLQGQPMAYAQLASQYPNLWAQMPLNLPGRGGTQIPSAYLGMTDIRESQVATGMYQQTMTGMPWGMSSLAMPGITSANVAKQIWGADWQKTVSPIGQELINTMIGGGQFALQRWQLDEQIAAQRAQAGLQLQQLALSKAFTTGVGINQYAGAVNPQTGQPFGFNTGKFGFNIPGAGSFTSQGGGFWGIEDAFRNLNWTQQQWGFGQQREQLSMQDRFFQQNFALNMQQSQMQRGWTRQDWGFQDQMRGMQWGWRQEDFQENLRFMTGRERRLAERQMGRETILYGAEGEQIDRQRKRQEELWKLEDERFRLQQSQHKEQLKFQEESIKKQEQFFEARKKLEEEQVKLQRAYWVEQMKIQEKQIAASVHYAEVQNEIALRMLEFSQFSQEAAAKGNLFNPDTQAELLEFFEAIAEAIKDLMKAGGGGKDGKDGDKVPKGPKDYVPQQYGGDVFAGQDLIVGEKGVEKFRPYFSGQIIPTHKLDPWQNGTPIQTAGLGDGKGQIRLVINLGGNLLREFILSAVDKEIDV